MIAARKRLPHGEFLEWIGREFEGYFGVRQAQKFARIARYRARIEAWHTNAPGRALLTMDDIEEVIREIQLAENDGSARRAGAVAAEPAGQGPADAAEGGVDARVSTANLSKPGGSEDATGPDAGPTSPAGHHRRSDAADQSLLERHVEDACNAGSRACRFSITDVPATSEVAELVADSYGYTGADYERVRATIRELVQPVAAYVHEEAGGRWRHSPRPQGLLTIACGVFFEELKKACSDDADSSLARRLAELAGLGPGDAEAMSGR